jgi:hypothetical protein
MEVNDPDEQEESYQISKYSAETELKMKIALFIRQVNMNKKDTNDLLGLIRGLSTV